jgi:ABC-type cobalt transport system substrate-binding protein
MATRSATLPIERSYLVKAWFAVAAIVVLAVAVVTIALAATTSSPAGGTDLRTVSESGQVQAGYEPIVVNGNVCGQCR